MAKVKKAKSRSKKKSAPKKRPAGRRTRRRGSYSVDLDAIERRTPSDDLWAYSYLLIGEKKIGKTSLAIEGCEELVLQYDKPQIAYPIKELLVENWRHFTAAKDQLLERAAAGALGFNRVVIDGTGEWYQSCQAKVCQDFAIAHPSEEGYARAWHALRDEFTAAVNDLLSLQESGCGVVFIAHSQVREIETRDGGKVDKMVPNLAPRCEEIVNGKVDGWFCYDYYGKDRMLIVQGDETVSAGHRIDGHFLTPDGRRVREVHMGRDPSEAMAAFVAAFNNEQEHATMRERLGAREGGKGSAKSKKKSRRRAKR